MAILPTSKLNSNDFQVSWGGTFYYPLQERVTPTFLKNVMEGKREGPSLEGPAPLKRTPPNPRPPESLKPAKPGLPKLPIDAHPHLHPKEPRSHPDSIKPQ